MLNNDIIALINEGVDDQHDLLNKLEKLGHKLTQSTISRKLKQLDIVKLHGKYKINQHDSSVNIKTTFVSPNLIIITCPPGYANVIAARIDNNLISNPKHPEFAGSIAGDDTIFLAINLEIKSLEKIKTMLQTYLHP